MDSNTEFVINVTNEEQPRVEGSHEKHKIHVVVISELLSASYRVAVSMAAEIWKVGVDDPRRAIHSIKVGIALAVVSLFYLTDQLFHSFGENAIWAVMTVVIVLEFTAGATLSKGLNRGLGTIIAGSLAAGMAYLSRLAGAKAEPVIIAISVFVFGAAATFSRFFPVIKKKFDYGIVIFMLTYNLIAISACRVDNILELAYDRLTTIFIGCAVGILISLLIFPIWAGQDLQQSMVRKLEGMAVSVEEVVKEYFRCANPSTDHDGEGRKTDELVGKGYKTVLDAKSTEESLANFASWEPSFRRCGYEFPSNHYVKFGVKLREFGYSLVALHGCLGSAFQSPYCLGKHFEEACIDVGIEAGKALQELADSIKNMKCKRPAESIMEHVVGAVEELNMRLQITKPSEFGLVLAEESGSEAQEIGHILSKYESPSQILLKSCENQINCNFIQLLPLATFISLLLESMAKLQELVIDVEELTRKAGFEKPYKDVGEDHGRNGSIPDRTGTLQGLSAQLP